MKKLFLFTIFMIFVASFSTIKQTPSVGVQEVPVEQTIFERLQGRNSKERGTLIAREMVKIGPKSVSRSSYNIEVVSLEEIEGGVQIFARVWNKNGNQIGFGADGTVDIERFIIINPPFLVSDPKGDYTRSLFNEATGIPEEVKYRVDYEEALLRTLEHTIAVKKEKFGSSKIITGKIGNTTSTFFPDANPEGTSVDGQVGVNGDGGNGSWATKHDAATGDAAFPSLSTGLVDIECSTDAGNPWRTMARIIILFDTSSISDSDTVNSATLSVYGNVKSNSFTGLSTANLKFHITSSSPASNTDITTADYDQLGTTTFGNVDYSSFTTGAYNDITLNASGVSAVSKVGASKFGARIGADIDNTEPTFESAKEVLMQARMADTAGTTDDPKLVVEHGVAAIPLNITSDFLMFE